MSQLSRVLSRVLVFALILFSFLSLGLGAYRVEAGADAASSLQRSTLNAQRSALADPHVVRAPAWMDRNGDRVDDRLEQFYRLRHTAGLQAPGAPPTADLMICLDHPPTTADLAGCRAMGATTVEAWGDLVYVIRARFPSALLPPEALERLGVQPGVTWVEENAVMVPADYFVTRQTRVRTAWGMGWEGDPNEAVAVLDTGLDASHSDFGGRLLAWQDFIGADAAVENDESPTPVDMAGHGTAVTGLAAGDGSAGGIATGAGTLNITLPMPLATSLTGGTFWGFFPVDTTGVTGASTLTARLKWQKALPDVTHRVQLLRDPASGTSVLSDASTPALGEQPFTLSVNNISAGVSSFFYRVLAATSANAPSPPLPAWLQISTPMSAVGDGFPLMRGAAPRCKIVAVRVFDNASKGLTSALLNGMSWVNANARALNIVCVNASLGFSTVSATVDTAVNQLVQNGVIWVNAAGNNRDSERDTDAGGQVAGIYSPGSASKAITVGATDELDRVTNYSSYAASGQRKPDLLAPGGSNFTGRFLVGVDTGFTDPLGTGTGVVADQFPNDYAVIGNGTSFASPQIAGAAMLVAQALGPWTFTEAQPRRVKMLLLMTASETNRKAEPATRDPNGQSVPLAPDTELNRGGRDRVEGYGRANPDAAVEAATRSIEIGAPVAVSLGPGAIDKKVWARNVTLTAGTPYAFALTNPPGADCDLFVYADTSVVSDPDGEPQLVASSTQAGLGGAEAIQFTPTTTGLYYVVVKFVAGSGGVFQLAGTTAADFTLSVSPGDQLLAVKGESVRYTVSVTGLDGFADAVNLSIAQALPPGMEAQFDPPTVTPGQSSVLTLRTTAAAPDGSQGFTIQGSAGALIRSVPAQLETSALWPCYRHDPHGLGRSALAGPQSYKFAWGFGYSTASVSSPAVGGDGTIYYGTRGSSGGSGGRLVAARPSDGWGWTFFVPTGRNVDSSPAVGVDGTIYFGADDGRLYALDPNGSPKWFLSLGSAPVRSGPVIGPDGTIYVTAGGSLYAVRPDGVLKWSFATGWTENSSPALASDGTIYFGAGSRLYAVRDAGSSGSRKWEFEAAGSVLSSPLVALNGSIYFGATGDGSAGRFYALADGGDSASKLAEYPTGGAVRSSPALGPDGSVYVGSDDNGLYAFGADGSFKWRYATGGAVGAAPVVGADGMIYVASMDRKLYALRDQGSAPKWIWGIVFSSELQGSPAIGAKGTLYLAPTGGFLYAFSAAPP